MPDVHVDPKADGKGARGGDAYGDGGGGGGGGGACAGAGGGGGGSGARGGDGGDGNFIPLHYEKLCIIKLSTMSILKYNIQAASMDNVWSVYLMELK